jgi:hypothetical protein
MSMRTLCLLLLTAALSSAQTNPVRPVQHTNGVVVSPTNFWGANSNAINAVVVGGTNGGGPSPNLTLNTAATNFLALSNARFQQVTTAGYYGGWSVALPTNGNQHGDRIILRALLASGTASNSAASFTFPQNTLRELVYDTNAPSNGAWVVMDNVAVARIASGSAGTNGYVLGKAAGFGGSAAENIPLSANFSSTNGSLEVVGMKAAGAPDGAVHQAIGGQGAWVASRMDSRVLAASKNRVNWTNTTVTAATNYESGFGQWPLETSSIYRVEYLLIVNQTATNSAHTNAFVFSAALNTNTSTQNRGFGYNAIGTVANISAAGTNPVYPIPGTAGSTGYRTLIGTFYFRTPTNSITLQYNWCASVNVTNDLTLLQGSMISVTKLAP